MSYDTFLEEKQTAMDTTKVSTKENIGKTQDKQQIAYQKKVKKKIQDNKLQCRRRGSALQCQDVVKKRRKDGA